MDPSSAPAGSHYAVLGIQPSASEGEIRQAHRRLALKWHPDKVTDATDEVAVRVATQQFQLLQAAYEEVSDPSRRKRYDIQFGIFGSSCHADAPPWKRAYRRQRTEEASGPPSTSWAHGDKSEIRVPADIPSVAAAVDALPASGGVIHVDAGYHVGLVVISKPFVKIFGIGRVTIQGQVVFRECAAGSLLRGLKIEANCSAGAVDLKGVTGDVKLEDLEISNSQSAGIIFEGCSGETRVSRCVVRGCKYDGLGLHLLKGPSNHKGSVVIEDSRFQDNGYDGLYLGDPRFQVSLTRTRICRNKRHGIFVRGTFLEIGEDVSIDANGKEALHREEFGPGRGKALQAQPRAREVDASTAKLPDGWRIFRTAEGMAYYYHGATGHTRWSHPAEAGQNYGADGSNGEWCQLVDAPFARPDAFPASVCGPSGNVEQ